MAMNATVGMIATFVGAGLVTESRLPLFRALL
jgi:hypothetical protein